MTDSLALFPVPTTPKSAEEQTVETLIESLRAERELTPAELVTAQMCRSLAKSISEGNAKGRSVANDVERLMATMAILTGAEAALDDTDGLTPAERELFDALGTPPGLDPAPNGYAA